MTYEQFWEQDVILAKHYRESFKMKRDYDNQMLHLQGTYIYHALCDVAPLYQAFKPKPPQPYMNEPFSLTDAQDKAKQAEKLKRDAERFAEVARIMNEKRKKQ